MDRPRCVSPLLGLSLSPFVLPAVVAIFLVLAGGCRSICCPSEAQLSPNPPRPARINHLAFFKLKNAEEALELIADCDEQLAVIPGVVSYYCGTHLDVGRSNVDGDYDVGFYVGFEDEEAYRTYVNHPSHVALVEKWKPRWEWIRVHDVLDESP
ncbi:MAG: Dabb family protein [Phycisphaerales bacterium]|nr:Dabb family protein [Phycisphaerales bacterium]